MTENAEQQHQKHRSALRALKNLIDGSNYDQFLMFVHSKAKLGILVRSLEDDYVQCHFDVQRIVQ